MLVKLAHCTLKQWLECGSTSPFVVMSVFEKCVAHFQAFDTTFSYLSLMPLKFRNGSHTDLLPLCRSSGSIDIYLLDARSASTISIVSATQWMKLCSTSKDKAIKRYHSIRIP